MTPRAFLVASFLAACGAHAAAPPSAVVPAQPPARAEAASPHAPSPIATSPAASPRAAPTIMRLSVGEIPCGLDADGRLWRWSEARMSADKGVAFPAAKAVACSISHTCVIASDDALFCWGGNGYGQLGDGTTTTRSSPARVGALPAVVEVGVAGDRTCARVPNGDVHCWGDSEFGKAGDGRMPDNVGREKTTPGAPILKGATALAVGATCACALTTSGKLSCWGQNHGGACGQPASTQYVPRPRVAPLAVDVASVATGTPITCAIDRAGAVACWGDFGAGGGTNKPTPVTLPGPAAEVEVGDRFACARLVSGAVHCWGANADGQLGDASSGDDRPQPVLVRGLSRVARIGIGINSVCALAAGASPGWGGRVTCWGLRMAEDGGVAKLPTDVVPEAM